MKRLVILQPGYLPWLGFFDQLHRADEFVIYDDVQYDRRGWRNRNRVKGPQGPIWLTVPVRTKGAFHQTVREARIENSRDWRRRHLETLRRCYRHAPFFEEIMDLLAPIYAAEWELLIDLDLALIRRLAGYLGIDTPLLFASEIAHGGGKTGRLLRICAARGATHYLTGDAAKGYIDRQAFAEQGITLEFQGYQHPEYPQLFGEFTPYLSIVDLLFNCGPESLAILAGQPRAGADRERAEPGGSHD